MTPKGQVVTPIRLESNIVKIEMLYSYNR